MEHLKRWANRPQATPAPGQADDDIPRYPPFAKGLPAASVDRVLATQAELIGQIRHTLALTGNLFESVVRPVIARYAAFTHLLPASETHHHRGAGGLFRHGLEVAHWAALASEGVLFAPGGTPRERKAQEPRWRLAVCLAGLLHDIGKPVSDLSVLDREGRTSWNPYIEHLTDWAAKNGVDRYFLRWREKRHQRHEQFSVLVTERVLTPECITFLTRTGPDIMQAMLEAIAGIDRGSTFYRLVAEADRKSVERDLKANYLQVDASLGVPVEKYLLDAMRRLVRSGRWQANEKGARIWRFRDGLHLVWRPCAREIVDVLAKDGIAGIPRDEDTLADILIERGLAVPNTLPDGTSCRYWHMQPDDLQVTLILLRLTSPELIYLGEPPTVVGGRIVTENDAESLAKSARDSDAPETGPEWHTACPATRTEGTRVASAQDRIPAESSAIAADEDRAATPPSIGERERPTATGKPPIDRQPAEEPGAGTPLQVRDASGTVLHVDTKTGEILQSPPEPTVAERPEPSAPASAPASGGTESDPDDTSRADAARRWLAAQGEGGELLVRLAEEVIMAGGWTIGIDLPDVDGKLLLPFPASAQKLGLEPAVLVTWLVNAGWVITDPLTPLRKVREINGVRGLLLAAEPSEALQAIAAHPRGAPAKAASVRSSSAETSPASPDVKAAEAAAMKKPKRVQKKDSRDPKPIHEPEPLTDPDRTPPNPGALAGELVARLRAREGLPVPVVEENGWLVAPATVLDWFVQQHPGVTLTALTRALFRREDCRLEGTTRTGVVKVKGGDAS